MIKNLLLALLVGATLFSCQNYNHSKTDKETFDERISTEKNRVEGEKEDGIREAQEMEFKMTRDFALGYVPKDRLIKATQELYLARKNGTYPNRTEALTWTERGPYLDLKGPQGNGRGTIGNPTLSGRIRAIWVDLKDLTNKTVWVGSASGGLWKTTDVTAGPPATWTVINDLLGNLAIMSICQDPTGSQNTMYLGTGEKTFNADAVRGGGVWKSTDNGVNWTLLSSTTSFVNVSKIVCDAAGNVYAATVGSGGLYRSTNGGTSWTNIAPAGLNSNVIDMNLSSTGRLHIVCGYTGAPSGYRFTSTPSTVTSGSWTTPTTTLSPTDNNVTLTSAGNTLYATLDNGSGQTDQVWKSTDGGANWAITGTTPPTSGSTPLSSGQAWYCQGLAVDPSNANNVMVGGLNTYLSTDGGATWAPNSVWVTGVPGSLNYIHADHQTFVWSTGNQILCGGDGGLSYSLNGGTSFSDRNEGLRIKQFYSCAIHPTSTNYFLAGAQDNGVHQLNGAGLASSLEVTGGDGGFVHIDENEPSYQFGSYTNNQYRRSTDAGASWSSFDFSSSAGQFINPTDYDDINNNFYGAWIAGNYVRWINAPVSGSSSANSVGAFSGGTVTHTMVSRFTPNRVFFGIDNGKIVKVDNANSGSPTATDLTASSGMTTNVSCIATGTSDNNLLATFSNYGAAHVWVSSTGGGAAGWTNITGNLPDIPVRWAMFNPEDNTKAILATEMGIYETTLINGGSTVWVQNAGFPTVRTDMLQYRYTDNTLLAATHGRGLWTSTITPTAPYVRFASSYIFSPVNTESTTSSGSVCRNYKDYTVNMHIDKAPVGAATVTLSLAGGPTATQGVDFDFTTNGNFASPSSVVTFPNAGTTDQPITIRVYDDAEVESTESFTLNYAVSGATDALAAPGSLSYTFYLGDNDAAPTVSTYSGNFALGTANTNVTTQGPFRSSVVKHRIQYLFTMAELNASGISGAGDITSMKIKVTTKNSAIPFNGFTISLGNTTASNMGAGFPAASLTQVYTGNYTSVSGDNNFLFTTPFVWDGTSNLLVNICFDNGASTSPSDLVEATAAPLGVGVRACSYANSADAGSGCSLAAAFVSDARITATFGASSGNPIESVLNNNRSEYVSNNGTYHFYNGYNIISKINGTSANLGCTSSNIFEAGATWQSFFSGLRSQKVIEVTPTTNSGASYTIGLYYTSAELNGQLPANIRIAKTTAATMAAVNSGNTVTATTTFAAFGSGYLFTASFTGFSKFFLVNNLVTLPVDLISFNGFLNNQDRSELHWQTTNQYNLSNFEVQRSYDGIQFNTAGIVNAIQNPASIQNYTFTDQLIAKAVNFYQLKMIDKDGHSKYSAIIRINNNKPQKFVDLVQNPVRENISFIINNQDKADVSAQLFSSSGQLVKQWGLGKIQGFVALPLNGMRPAGGIYTLRISAGNKTENLRISIQ